MVTDDNLHTPIEAWPGLRVASGMLLAAALILAMAVALVSTPAVAAEVVVFAAASLTNALGAVAQTYEKNSGNDIALSFAASSTLARQIAHGAPADIDISADVQWMDYLQKRGRILTGTRMNLLANRLVLIAPITSKTEKVAIHAGFPLAALLGNGYLAMGNPAHVPAGIYGKQALKSLGVWQSVKGQVARAANVRAALALVDAGEAPLGIVYRTDAMADDKVKIVAAFPESTHPPVGYPAALTPASEGNKAAQDFFHYIQSDKAAAIFTKYGFMRRR